MESTVAVLKNIFVRHSIPNTIVANNMPFNRKIFKQFAAQWDFKITASSPQYPQSIGLVEQMSIPSSPSLIMLAMRMVMETWLCYNFITLDPITRIETSS